jgi:nucleoside-diphosphate-sugar epimerase
MRYLVAGGAGFIGSHLCEELLHRDNEVICLDNFITGAEENIKHLENNKHFSIINADLLFRYPVSQIDGIFHLASPTAPSMIQNNPETTIMVNTSGTLDLIHHAESSGAKMLFVSSVKIHGDCPRVQPYIIGKRSGEYLCNLHNAKVARLASVFGPRMRKDDSRVIPVFIKKALANEPLSLWNGGRQIDSFCYVSDIVDGLIKFMESVKTGVIEFGYPKGISIYDLAMNIIELADSSSNIETTENIMVVDECHKVADLQRAGEELFWEPRIDLTEGLSRMIEFYR